MEREEEMAQVMKSILRHMVQKKKAEIEAIEKKDEQENPDEKKAEGTANSGLSSDSNSNEESDENENQLTQAIPSPLQESSGSGEATKGESEIATDSPTCLLIPPSPRTQSPVPQDGVLFSHIDDTIS